jgi:tRNA U55 pseudouridine synthase TruB
MLIKYHKEIGESLQDVINRFKIEYNLDSKEKVAFAGRLDPIAFGIIKLMTGEDLKLKDKMCEQNKIYTYTVLESFQTDTYDVLGLITNLNSNYNEKLFEDSITFDQPYPSFSSKTVKIDGRKMRLWNAKKTGKLIESIEIPTKKVTIFYNRLIKRECVTSDELFTLITNRIEKVKGDFRQKETLELWKTNLEQIELKTKCNKFKLNFYETKLSSGGYVRSIANSMGGVAFDICRKDYLDNV